MTRDRVPLDMTAYARRARSGTCFVCAWLASDPAYAHEMIYDDGEHVAFLNRYPTLYGYVLVAPRAHLEHVVRDLDVEAYPPLGHRTNSSSSTR